MKLDEITNKQDEYYTPKYAVKPILKYLKPKSLIWCPFDTEKSEFVKLLEQAGHSVIYTHIKDSEAYGLEIHPNIKTGNFFEIVDKGDLSSVDYIISNPPYSMKNEVLETLFNLGKPFAMLIGVVGIFESKKRFNLFKNNNFEIMYLDKRVSYFDGINEKPTLNPPFSSAYITKDTLPKKIVFEEIDKKDIK